eukprot:15092555-Alexandrium_andersonii.AAC.1
MAPKGAAKPMGVMKSKGPLMKKPALAKAKAWIKKKPAGGDSAALALVPVVAETALVGPNPP